MNNEHMENEERQIMTFLDEEGNKSIVNFDNLAFLNNLDDVDSIEIYYNGAVCDIEHSFTNAYIWDTTKGFKLREEV